MTINIEEKISGWLTPAVASGTYDSDWFKKRVEVIRSLVQDAPMDRTIALLSVFLEVATTAQNEEIAKLIQNDDLSYDRGNTFLNRLIAGACLIESLNTREINSDAIALAASTFSFQQMAFATTNTLVKSDFFTAARKYLAKEMQKVRPPLGEFEKIEEYSKKAVATTNIKKTIGTIADGTVDRNTATVSALTEITEHLGKIQGEVIDRVNVLIDSANRQLQEQRTQIAIAREESNLLWWLFGEFSRDEEKPFSEFGVAEAAVRLGKEAADLTEFVPGHTAARGILHKALRLLPPDGDEVGDPLSFSDLLSTTTPDWTAGDGANVMSFCHVHRAFRLRAEKGKGWKQAFEGNAPFRTSKRFSLLDISYQVYQERLLIRTVAD